MNDNNENMNKMSIDDFVKKYNATTSEQIKQKIMQEVVYSTDFYVPYAVKVVTAHQIIEASNFNNNGEVYFNGPKQYQIYIAALLSLYTKLDVTDHFDTTFDLLCKNHLLDNLIKLLPDDRADFEVVFQLVQTDFERNYVDKKMNEKQIIDAVYKGLIKGINDIIDGIDFGIDVENLQTIISGLINENA